MNYELAKKLKDAGFPFKIGHTDGKTIHFGETVTYAPPTLSELIEACGDKFRGVEVGDWKPTRWYAKSKDEIIVEAETPEDAVANLWLELNKHDRTTP